MNPTIEFLNQKKNIFLACSGGMDSMALANTLLSKTIPFSIAHCNFQLRGEESNQDEEFVKKFAQQHHIPFYSISFDTEKNAKQEKTSIEEAARNLRYRYFQSLTHQYQIDAFLLAHHLDDDIETILMRIVSGTGIQGIQGIGGSREPNYFRPMLHISRIEIENYVIENKIAYREDSSNIERKYKRNKIRHDLIPIIQDLNPNYRKSIQNIKTWSTEISEILRDQFECCKEKFDQEKTINLAAYQDKGYISTILHYIFQRLEPSSDQIHQIKTCLFDSERHIIRCGYITLEVKNGIIIQMKQDEPIPILFQNLSDLKSDPRFQILENPTTFEPQACYIDLDKMNFPIVIRSFEFGDHIQPYGMKGKSKKLSDLFQQMKWSTNQKRSNCIIEDSHKNIIGILGMMSSHMTAIDTDTKQFIGIKQRK
jgi:tRNA(Ile)-lysidine synthase